MNWWVCVLMLLVTWTGGFLHSLVQFFFIYWLPFCGPNVIDNFICDMYLLLKLACNNTHLIRLSMIANGGEFALSSSSFSWFLMGSYYILLRFMIWKWITKAFHNCASHITVVILFIVHCIFLYVRPASTITIDKLMTFVLTFITPMMNPLIYTLRNA